MSFNCSKCKREFDCKEVYDKHVKMNRCKEPYVCKKCEYTTNRKSSYQSHINTKKCKKNCRRLNFKCEQCDAMFRDNYDLQKHLNRKKPCISKNNTTNNIQNVNNGIVNNGNMNNIEINLGAPNGINLQETIKLKECFFELMQIPRDLNNHDELEKFKFELQSALLKKELLLEVL